MKAQILLSPSGAKHLISLALIKKLDFTKRIYFAYGVTNQYILYHLGFKFDNLYMAGGNFDYKLNVNENRPKPIVLENKKEIDIKDFDINKNDILIKGANALWYENNIKQAAVLAADKNGGTYGNFYIKAAARGAGVIIPVTHEKLIPFYYPATQNVDFAMGNKVALLRFFYGKIYTEIEAFRDLFNVKANIIASGGILDTKGAIVFEVEGDNAKKALEFCEKYNSLEIEV